MDAILKDLGMTELLDVFQVNDITPNVVLGLTEEEFTTLGISSIGDRVRLRERCRDYLRGKDEPESPIVKRIKTLIKARSGKGKRCLIPNNRKVKETRKVIIGWKHDDGTGRTSYKLVNSAKGGGKQELDINKNFTKEETTELFASFYFPNGLNTASGRRLETLTYFVATFTGQPISDLFQEGSPSTFGDVVNLIGTSPLRLYLHTKRKDADDQPNSTYTESAAGSPRPIRTESAGGSSRPIRTESAGGSPRPSRAESAAGSPRPIRTESAGGSSRPIRTESAGGSPKPSRAESAGGSSRPIRTESAGGSSRPIRTESAGGSPRPIRTESAGGSPRAIRTESASGSSRLIRTESAGGSPRAIRTESAGGSSRPIRTESAGGSSRPIRTESAGGSPRVIRTESAGGSPRSICTDSAGGSPRSISPVEMEISPTHTSAVTTTDVFTLTGSTSADEDLPEVFPVLPDLPDILDITREFEDADTPTVSFRTRQNRLCLHRQPLHHQHLQAGPPDLTFEGILKWWRDRTVLNDELTTMIINRTSVLSSALRVFKRQDFNFCRQPKIIFSGEDGEDLGGPRREFLRLLMKAVEEDIFYGGEDGKFFNHNVEKLGKTMYEMSGAMTAFSILHGGPGLPVLHPAVYQFLTKQEAISLPPIKNVVLDLEVQEKLLAIEQANNQEEYATALQNICDWCCDQGLSVFNYKKFEDRQDLMDLLMKNEIFFRVQAEIVQFQNGMNRVGTFFEHCLVLSPEAMETLFTNKDVRLTFPILRSMYTVIYSPEGTNDRRGENDVIYCLEAFLADSESGSTGVTLAQVLSFWTGATAVPPLGFHKNLEVSFVKSDIKRLPSAHTCTMVLRLWLGYSDPDVFQDDMVKAITWGGGFHLV